MSLAKSIFMHAFGRPKGVLGRLGGIIMARTNQKVVAWAIDLLDVQPDDSVLEVGFGPGVGIELLAKAVASGRVAGVDDSKEMVAQATARNAQAIGRRRVDLQRSSVERLPFEDNTFQKALAINSLQVWPDAIAGLREMRRVVKVGGTVALGFNRHSGQPKSGLVGVPIPPRPSVPEPRPPPTEKARKGAAPVAALSVGMSISGGSFDYTASGRALASGVHGHLNAGVVGSPSPSADGPALLVVKSDPDRASLVDNLNL
jgi:SAM-dependent methyltransferase